MIIGLKNLTWFPITEDKSTGTTYGAAVTLAGAIDAKINPENVDPEIVHADDVEWDSVTPDAPYNIEVETVGFTLANLAALQGHSLSTKGGVVVKEGDEPPYGAIAFQAAKSAKAGGGYRYVVLYKVKPAFAGAEYHTKEGSTITRQRGKMTLRGISRISDGLKQYITEDSTEATNFFTAPITPTMPSGGT
jgi:phi13 family phage major tail protein